MADLKFTYFNKIKSNCKDNKEELQTITPQTKIELVE